MCPIFPIILGEGWDTGPPNYSRDGAGEAKEVWVMSCCSQSFQRLVRRKGAQRALDAGEWKDADKEIWGFLRWYWSNGEAGRPSGECAGPNYSSNSTLQPGHQGTSLASLCNVFNGETELNEVWVPSCVEEGAGQWRGDSKSECML